MAQRVKLFPELQEEIISTFWNSYLSPQERTKFIWSASLVNKHWKGMFVLCAFRDYYFSSVYMYKWYLVTIHRQYLGQDVISKDLCRSITYYSQLGFGCPAGVNSDQELFLPSCYPNLRSIYVESIPIRNLGSEGFWVWLETIPVHISSLQLSFVLPAGTRYGNYWKSCMVIRDWRDWTENRRTKGAASITYLNIEGVDDGNLVWDLFDDLFPNLAIMSCGGHLVERPPVQLKSINAQNIINYQDYMSNISKRQECNKRMNQVFDTIVQQVSLDLQDAAKKTAQLLSWRISGDPKFHPTRIFAEQSVDIFWYLDGDFKLNSIDIDMLNTKLKDLDLEKGRGRMGHHKLNPHCHYTLMVSDETEMMYLQVVARKVYEVSHPWTRSPQMSSSCLDDDENDSDLPHIPPPQDELRSQALEWADLLYNNSASIGGRTSGKSTIPFGRDLDAVIDIVNKFIHVVSEARNVSRRFRKMALKGRATTRLLNCFKAQTSESTGFFPDTFDTVLKAQIFFNRATALAQKADRHGWARRCIYGVSYKIAEAKLQKKLEAIHSELEHSFEQYHLRYKIREQLKEEIHNDR
ncbi:hypothetical protein BDQ17DRAFT_1345786 [Cyathus striatus]|nr:hypothetical protein BDQ17DRAFT_1345786 [Cyathus striatus]